MKIKELVKNKVPEYFTNDSCACHKSHLKNDNSDVDYLYWREDEDYNLKKAPLEHEFKKTVPVTEHQKVVEIFRKKEWQKIGKKERKKYNYYVIIYCNECDSQRKEIVHEEKMDEYRRVS